MTPNENENSENTKFSEFFYMTVTVVWMQIFSSSTTNAR